MPQESIRDQIFDNVKNNLKNIKGAPEYFYLVEDEKINVIHGGKGSMDFKEPFIYLYPGTEVVTQGEGERGKFYKVLTIDIEAWVRSDESMELMNRNINRILHDLEKAVMLDHCRSDGAANQVAIDTMLISNQAFMEALDSPKCGVILTINVLYQQNTLDPSKVTI